MKKVIYIFAFIAYNATAQSVTFTFEDVTFEAGQTVEMPCRAYEFVNMAAFQWGILFDTACLKLDSVKATNQLPEYGADNFSYFEISQSQFIKPGSLYTLWTGVPCRTLEEGSTIFRAWFTAKKAGSLAGSVINYPQGLAFEAINCGFQYLNLWVGFTSEATSTITISEPVFIAPNPFYESFTVSESGLLRIHNTTGQVVIFANYRAGDPVGVSLTPGVYFGALDNRRFKIVKQ